MILYLKTECRLYACDAKYQMYTWHKAYFMCKYTFGVLHQMTMLFIIKSQLIIFLSIISFQFLNLLCYSL